MVTDDEINTKGVSVISDEINILMVVKVESMSKNNADSMKKKLIS